MTPFHEFERGVCQPEVAVAALDVIERLSPDPSLDAYRAALHRVTSERRPYWDLACALNYLAERGAPTDYLEIGVRRGKSMAQVASRQPTCRIVGCDIWMSPTVASPIQGHASCAPS